MTPALILPHQEKYTQHKIVCCASYYTFGSFRIQIVWFQTKQESDRIRISFFKNKVGSDSKNTLSDHLWSGASFFTLYSRYIQPPYVNLFRSSL